MAEHIHLVDLITDARIEAPGKQYVEIQNFIINREAKTCLFQHPDSIITFPPLRIQRSPCLRFGTVINQTVWDKLQAPIRFKMSIESAGRCQELFQFIMDPGNCEHHRGWITHCVSLGFWAGKVVRIKLETISECKAHAWAGWSDPVIEHSLVNVGVPRKYITNHKHIFLLTGDALSKRFLGCYGAREMSTPNIDELAGESLILDEAYSGSTVTLGGYANLLTGSTALKHGMDSEWALFDPGTDNLVTFLRGCGYHTAVFPSEQDLQTCGFTDAFDQVIPCISNPAQDGAVTIRSVKRFLDQLPDQPVFNWIQFFDTHPPSIPPAPFSGMYYENDPSSFEAFPGRIYGIESAADLDLHLPLIREGRLISPFRERLHDCALALQGALPTGSDLYQHILNLPAHVTLGMSHTEFGRWLLREIKDFEERGSASVALVDWLELMLKEIAFIQHSITGWIDRVDDFRYPVAQYKASISYFDHLVGLFISELKHRNLFDQSIIIVTSPHGEVMSYDDVAFHHHLPHPHVFEIPLIWKSPHSAHKGRVQGIISLTDVYPTLAGWLKPDVLLPGMVGKDLHLDLEEGQLPVDWTLGFDMKDVTRTLIKPPFFYVVARKDCKLTGTWEARKNEAFLFERTDDFRGMQAVFDPSLMMRFRQDYQKIMEDPDKVV